VKKVVSGGDFGIIIAAKHGAMAVLLTVGHLQNPYRWKTDEESPS
jgi:hypothetical protein